MGANMMGKEINISDQRKTLITKGISLVLGLISFAVVFVVKYVPGVLHAAIAIFGMVGGPILGVFSLGMFVPFANTVGALPGLLTRSPPTQPSQPPPKHRATSPTSDCMT